MFESDLDNPQDHLSLESAVELVGVAPTRVEAEVKITNTHRRKSAILTHDSCPLAMRGLAQENTTEIIWGPDYVCTQPLITTRIPAKKSGTIKTGFNVHEATTQGVAPGTYEVIVAIRYNETDYDVFSAGTVAISDAIDPMPAVREVEGIRFETTNRKNDTETGYLTDITLTNILAKPTTIRQFSDEACPLFLSGFQTEEARDTYYLQHDTWNPWEQLVNKKCLLNFEPLTLEPGASHTLTAFTALPRQANITLPQYMLAHITVRLGEDEKLESFLIAAGEIR